MIKKLADKGFRLGWVKDTKKAKKESAKKSHADHAESTQKSLEKKPGFFKKMFNRKSV